MRRKTQKFIESQNRVAGLSSGAGINWRLVAIIAAIVAGAFLLGGLYIWYVRTYGGARKITLYEEEKKTYEWLQITSNQGITGDYLWSRTNELMVDGGADGVLVPTWYMIEGRLSGEDVEESGVYNLADQALLLKIYVRDNNRSEASKLKSRVMSDISLEEASLTDRMMWLEAYLEYYSAYGTSKDLRNIEDMVSVLFDENGLLRPVSLVYPIYAYDNIEEINTAMPMGYVDFEGVPLSALRLRLIHSLETNDFIPEGSYEANLNIVLGSIVSEDIPLYPYAYYQDESGISYVNSYRIPMTIDVEEMIMTMRNLAEVDELDGTSYAWLKNNLMNGSALLSGYSLTTRQLEGEELLGSYLDVMAIAYNCDDMDLYSVASYREAMRVATYTNSPALSMVYRMFGDRFRFYARENLELVLALM